MGKLISFCGLVCDGCGAYLATKTDDDEKRKEVSETWSKLYGADIKPADINCNGCRSEGETVFSYCRVCGIRKCGREKGVQNCAHCEEYICDKLEKFFEMAPEAKKKLDEIRSGI